MKEHLPPPPLQLAEALMCFCAGPVFSVKIGPAGMPDKRGALGVSLAMNVNHGEHQKTEPKWKFPTVNVGAK